MGALANVANLLVGTSRDEYKCNQVVNEVLYGNKDAIINGQKMLAKAYLTWGIETTEPDEGVIVVGNDGVHVGIFTSKTEFVHSSYGRKEVVSVKVSPNKQELRWVFPLGYTLRKEK
ncbi:hypothetical protein GCM10027592_45770 [Spirosoma flavus]